MTTSKAPQALNVSGATFTKESVRGSAWDTRWRRMIEHRGQRLDVQLFTDASGHGCWAELSRRIGKGAHECLLVMIDGRAGYASALRAAMHHFGMRIGKSLEAQFYDAENRSKDKNG